MEESVSSLMNMTLSNDKFADESTTERSQSPGDMNEYNQLGPTTARSQSPGG